MSFSFGQAGGGSSSTPNKPLFGATSSGGTSSLFSGTTNTTSTGSSAPTGSGLFSGASGAKPASSTLFGNSSAPATNKPTTSPFGANQASSGASQPGTSPFSFASPNGGGAAKPSLFSGAGNTQSTGASAGGTSATSTPTFSFGNATGSSTPAATPAANKTFSLPSTTPAGPPPGNSLFGGQPSQASASANTGSSLFSSTKAAPASGSSTPSLFNTANTSSTTAKPLGSTTSGSGLFTGFGNKDASADGNKSAPAQPSLAPSSLFGGGAQSGTQGTQGTPKPSLFGNLGSTTPSSTPASKPPTFSLGTTPVSSQPASSQPLGIPAKPSGPGGNTPASASSGAATSMFSGLNATSSASGGSSTGFSFPKLGGTTPTSSTPITGAAATTTTTTAATTSTPSTVGSSLFSNLGGAASAASSGPSSTSTAAPSLFSKPAGTTVQPSTSTAATTAPTAATGGPTTTAGDTAKPGLGSSTTGPLPSAQSRLKNKSMDEIITRWAADLSKYQKEFQQQAETVAKWDRALVENSDKVKQLYAKTFQAERDAAEVERQLTSMEDNQQELDSYLDRYEKEIENMMRTHGVGSRSDGLRGPDQERERTYKLAEKLQDRLNELNKDLTEMIEEINTTSQTLSKTGKPDDPLTKVVRVLNSQLSQLQLIDTGAAQLQEKIDKAQKESQRVGTNGWNGLGTDPAEDFYRSLRGGRTDRFGGIS